MGSDPGSDGVVSSAIPAVADGDVGDQKLGKGESSRYGAVAARANYLGVDRPDLRFAIKEACRGKSAPSEADMRRVNRIARYIQADLYLVITTVISNTCIKVISNAVAAIRRMWERGAPGFLEQRGQ